MKKIILIASLIIFTSGQSFSQAGTVTLGVAIKQLSNLLNQAIENAKNAGLNLEIEAGREVALSLESFKNVYAASLNTTFDKLDKLTVKQWGTLQSLTNQIQTTTVNSLGIITANAQQLVSSLPFHPHQPHLRASTPSYIVPSNHNYEVTISCQGIFEDVGDKDYHPTLKIGGHTYSYGGTNQQVEFHVPIVEFMKSGRAEKYKFGYVQCEINFPWKDKYLHVFPRKRNDTYVLYIGMLPLQPGHLVLTQKITTPNTLQQTHVTNPPHRQSSCSDGGNVDKRDVPQLETPDNGWSVVRGSSKFNQIDPHGDWGVVFVSDDGNRVVYSLSTFHHGITGGPSGCLDFTISFSETKDDTKITYSDISYDVNWGDSKTIDIPAGEWKLKFTAFDGSVNEFAGPDITNPFIQIIATAGIYKLVTANPSTLNWH